MKRPARVGSLVHLLVAEDHLSKNRSRQCESSKSSFFSQICASAFFYKVNINSLMINEMISQSFSEGSLANHIKIMLRKVFIFPMFIPLNNYMLPYKDSVM